jgi:hypothetical protein
VNLRQGTFFFQIFSKNGENSPQKKSVLGLRTKKIPKKTLTGSGGGEDPGREREGINRAKKLLHRQFSTLYFLFLLFPFVKASLHTPFSKFLPL